MAPGLHSAGGMGDHSAIWNEVQSKHARPRLTADRQVDVVVIGAGITGVSTALRLRRAGLSVALIERNRAGDGDTGGTSAHVATQLDNRYSELASNLSSQDLRLLAQAARRSVSLIETLARDEGVACQFQRVPGFLYTAHSRERQELQDECALLQNLEFAASLTREVPVPYAVECAVRVDDQAIFQPRAYVLGLLERAAAAGVEVFEGTAVTSFSDGDRCTVETEHGPVVTAQQVVFAAHNPLSRLALQNKLEHYNSYVLAFPANGPASPALVCDTEDPYHYIRTFELGGQTYWIVGGEDHRTGDEKDTEAPYRRLIQWTAERFGVAPGGIPYRWSSQVVESADGLPHIGRVPGAKNLWIATGFGGNGMTWGSLAAEMISEAILGRPSPYADLFEAGRAVPLGDIPTVMRDGAFVAGCYLGDVLKLAETDGLDSVPKGEGRVVRHEGALVAASRDEAGKLRVVKARCPHLGGLVRFNQAEKTWDCPCHGSRFDADGKVLTGPALTGLEAVAVEAKG